MMPADLKNCRADACDVEALFAAAQIIRLGLFEFTPLFVIAIFV